MGFGKIFILAALVLGIAGYILLKDKDVAQWKETLSTSLVKDWKTPSVDETKAKLQLMINQKEALQKKMEDLKNTTVDKANQTVEKAQRIQKSIEETKAAYDQTMQSIENLQTALDSTSKELGVKKE